MENEMMIGEREEERRGGKRKGERRKGVAVAMARSPNPTSAPFCNYKRRKFIIVRD